MHLLFYLVKLNKFLCSDSLQVLESMSKKICPVILIIDASQPHLVMDVWCLFTMWRKQLKSAILMLNAKLLSLQILLHGQVMRKMGCLGSRTYVTFKCYNSTFFLTWLKGFLYFIICLLTFYFFNCRFLT